MHDPDIVILLFTNGKLVCARYKAPEEISFLKKPHDFFPSGIQNKLVFVKGNFRERDTVYEIIDKLKQVLS